MTSLSNVRTEFNTLKAKTCVENFLSKDEVYFSSYFFFASLDFDILAVRKKERISDVNRVFFVCIIESIFNWTIAVVFFFFLFFFPSKFFIYRIQHRKEFKSRQTLNEVTRRRIYFSRGKRINASSRVKNFQRQFTALLRFDSSKMYSNCRWVFIIHSCLS